MKSKETAGFSEPDSSEFNRRDFFKVLGAGLGALTSSERAEGRSRNYHTGNLAGRKFSDLFSEYTGIYGKVPETVSIDFENQLRLLWVRKNQRAHNNRVVVQTGAELLKEYQTNPHTLLELNPYIRQIQQTMQFVRTSLDWAKYSKLKGLKTAESLLAKELSFGFDCNDLLAYSLTELMPSNEGVLNRELLAFLLKYAGREYIESIPAIHDPKTSFGPYQFTEYALFDDGIERRGASIPNQALKQGKIPGSVSMLRGLDHHKAAYLFVIDNITNLVAKASPTELAVLKAIKSSKHHDFVAYVATAHHGPGTALHIAKRWLDNGAKAPYEASADSAYRSYVDKTKANLNAFER
jgi:hypothetical protein